MCKQTGTIVGEVRWGALSATLWANETRNGEMLTVTLRRGYQRQPGQWEATKMSLPHNQLLAAAELLREMHGHGWEYFDSQREAAEEGEEVEAASE